MKNSERPMVDVHVAPRTGYRLSVTDRLNRMPKVILQAELDESATVVGSLTAWDAEIPIRMSISETIIQLVMFEQVLARARAELQSIEKSWGLGQ